MDICYSEKSIKRTIYYNAVYISVPSPYHEGHESSRKGTGSLKHD